MTKTKVYLAMAAALTLTACGGGSSSEEASPTETVTTEKEVTTKEYKAIDGYLVNADIYVDRNKNKIADEDEKLDQVTGEEGPFSLDEADTQYPVIIKAVAGRTSDTDNEGAIKKDFTFVADAGVEVISPFSTTAYNTDKTLEELATELNLPLEVLSSDYVAKKNSEETESDAKKIHALARTLTKSIINKTDSEKLVDIAKTTLEDINEYINNAEDLDKFEVIDTLKDRLTSETFTVIHTNELQFKEEGVFTDVTFNDTEVSVVNNGKKESHTIKYNDDSFQVANDSLDYIVHFSSDWMLIKTTQNELSLFIEKDSTEKLNEYVALTESDFVGRTLYHFWDDSTTGTPDPDFVTLKYSSEGNEVTILEGGEESKFSWKIDSDGNLVIEGAADGSDIIMSKTAASDLDDEFLIFNYGTSENIQIPYFATENKTLADNIFEQWNK
ncbi:hypothetical protein [Photobacterium leiognathi]|uniref:hypothetical protein n=1 Tax=Photobacterium leiognathi TaxID=553611 RepID=UPI0027353FE4|nr:hypothetical protein [Photobacterium leiognathi]